MMLRKKIPSIRHEIIKIDESAGTFEKFYSSGDLKDVVLKLKSIEAIAAQSTWFKIPRVLSIDYSEKKIIQEFIPGLVPIRLLIDKPSLLKRLLFKVGNGLAEVHKELTMDSVEKILLPPTLNQFTKYNAFLHLDFNTINVQYNEDTDVIYFLDWEITPILGGMINYGSIYYDLIHMVYQLYLNEPYIRTKSKMKDSLVNSFIEGYESYYGPLDKTEFYTFGTAYLKLFREFDKKEYWKYLIKCNNFKNFENFLQHLRNQ